jgi:hypothetical protein
MSSLWKQVNREVFSHSDWRWQWGLIGIEVVKVIFRLVLLHRVLIEVFVQVENKIVFVI